MDARLRTVKADPSSSSSSSSSSSGSVAGNSAVRRAAVLEVARVVGFFDDRVGC